MQGPQEPSEVVPQGAVPQSAPEDSSLPVATEPEKPRGKRVPFWKRIRVRGSVRRAQQLSESSPFESVLARLETIEGQLTAVEDALAARFDHVEERFNRMWEIEDQLEQIVKLRDRLHEMRDAQVQLAESHAALRRTVGWLAVLMVVGVVAMLSIAALQ
jgi:DNA-binding FrmR family transcriptional regulator